MSKIKVAILGATGVVGQRFVQFLHQHPWFEIVALAASPSSVGKRYGEVVKWCIEGSVPKQIADLEIVASNFMAVEGVEDVELVFSALPADVAAVVEPEFARGGIPVASNASAFRMEEDVPILIPEVNPEHISLIDLQRKRRKWSGYIVTNPNCTTSILVLSLKPIFDKFGIHRILITTMQAISGAGYDGLPSMAIMDNVIPYIAKEEKKVEMETRKILGKIERGNIVKVNFKISTSCNRVLVYDGHTEVVYLETEKHATPEEIVEAMKTFQGKPQYLKLPTAPKKPIIVRDEMDRPQPHFDRNAGRGMSVVVGRVRRDTALENGIKYVVLGHNTIRGAAGASVLNAELLLKEGYIP